MRVVIIGAVAGGASAAARARRLDEHAEITLVERGEAPSFANCGLPYFIGGVIESRDKLLVAPVAQLVDRYRLTVRTRTEALAVDRQAKSVTVRDLTTDEISTLPYDKLVLAPGASPLRPPFPGADLPSVYTLRDLRDADRLHALAATAKRAVVVGAGFIGLEMTENLVRRGLTVSVVELAPQVLPPWDAEMVAPVAQHLRDRGVELKLQDAAEAIEPLADGQVRVKLKSGAAMEADFVVLAIGVRPENKLAVDAGLEVGPRGGIVVNRHMQTSDPDVYAVGDAVQVRHVIDGSPVQIPLGGPANRQGRIAADHMVGRDSAYRGTQGTAVVGVFDMTAAMTGFSEKALVAAGIPFRKATIHPGHHAGYYPGAQAMTLKLMFAPDTGKLLGAEGVGRAGVDKRIDVLAVAIQAGMTVYDLEEMELAYAPQYGSAKDPINMLGFVGAGMLRGDHPTADPAELLEGPALGGAGEGAGYAPPHRVDRFLLDVRTPAEFHRGHVFGAKNIPIEELRGRLDELPRDLPIVAYCQVGMRGYLATRLLLQHGFNAANLSGGYASYEQYRESR
ncbi:MAG: FAD-dependent oxidoreductase [Pirellulales bacterium]|nr:FAD-dependent oxidoreductase [Pirellulales bacterium]